MNLTMRTNTNHHKHRTTPFVVRCSYNQAVVLSESTLNQFDRLHRSMPSPLAIREGIIDRWLPRPLIRRFTYTFVRGL